MLNSKPQKFRLANSAAIAAIILMSSCGDQNISGLQSNDSQLTASDKSRVSSVTDSNTIWLDLNLKFKNEILSKSKFLESNNGTEFSHIISIDSYIKPGEILDLQELQPYGIFGLCINSDSEFTLYNSGGLSINAKTILFEKCSFIDLKLANNSTKSIHITGFVAGE